MSSHPVFPSTRVTLQKLFSLTPFGTGSYLCLPFRKGAARAAVQTLGFPEARPAKPSPDPLTFQSLLDFFTYLFILEAKFRPKTSSALSPPLLLLPTVVTLVEFIFKPQPSDTFQTEERRQPSTFLLVHKSRTHSHPPGSHTGVLDIAPRCGWCVDFHARWRVVCGTQQSLFLTERNHCRKTYRRLAALTAPPC